MASVELGGDAAWTVKTARRMDLEAGLHPRGRPRKHLGPESQVPVYQRSAVIAAQWVPIREPACTNLAGYIANHSAGQQYSGYWQPSEVQQADQQVTKP